MSKTMMINKIELEIKVLTPVEQVKLFNWFGNLLGRTQRKEIRDRSGITARLNKVYAENTQGLELNALTAQLVTLEREVLMAQQTGLPKDSVANVSQVLTIDKSFLAEKAGKVRKGDLQKIEEGLRLSMGL